MKSIEQKINNAAPVRAGRLLLGALGTLVLLTACGGTDTPDAIKGADAESGTTTYVATKKTMSGGTYAIMSNALPKAGTPLGTIIGDKNGTVTVVPEQDEITVLEMINEVRATNTINGKAVESFACTARRNLPPLRYSGLASYAAEGHANYLTHNAVSLNSPNQTELHDQLNTKSEYYTGTEMNERLDVGANETALKPADYRGEIVGAGQSSARAVVYGWLNSEGHCKEIFKPVYTHFGVGKAENPNNDQSTPDSTGRFNLKTAWVVNFTSF